MSDEKKGNDDLDDKYGALDLTANRAAPAPRRVRRPAAVSALDDQSTQKSMVDKISDERDALKVKLATLEAGGESAATTEKLNAANMELAELKASMESLRVSHKKDIDNFVTESKKSSSQLLMPLTMPTTKTVVHFELKSIDPDLIDISDENERIQTFLDEISLADILPSIKKHRQQKPGMLRKKADGRYELIEGSRRLAAVKIAGFQYLSLVGDVPDADVRELSLLENRHKDVSIYEKAKAYSRRIADSEYTSWQALSAAYHISETHMRRYQKAATIDDLFVSILPSPSDMTLTYPEEISKLLNSSPDNKKKLEKEAKRLLSLRDESLANGVAPLDYDNVFKSLKSAVRKKSTAPTYNRPFVFKDDSGDIQLKYSVTRSGSYKFEVSGSNDKSNEVIIEHMKRVLKVK
jgi:ParB family chromosome partitioning protein